MNKPSHSFQLSDTEQSIASRFEQIVAEQPTRTALLDGNLELSYDELNQQANHIAHKIHHNTEPSNNHRICIYLDKSAQYVASILAVLKSGICYVPLDPTFPIERTHYILKDVSPSLIITERKYLSIFENDYATLCVEEVDTALPSDNPNHQTSPDGLAYIIYTSGSTGTPKGVVQNNRNALHGCMRRTHLQNISIDDRLTQLYSFSVMGSTYCMFGALLNGASLHLYDIRRDGLLNLSTWLEKQQITIYHSVASVFRTFARLITPSNDKFVVRMVIFGGEKVLRSDVELARRVFSKNIDFFTGLGSTETGTIRHFPINPNTELTSKIVPIGFPIEGVTIELRNENDHLVEEGEIGEIVVCSQYIALGYWNDQETTEKVFGVHSDSPQLRTYKTGDLAQCSGNSLLIHKGRRDFQVKIRGFRVELSEIESALLNHSDIQDAVVTANVVGTDTQLFAYLHLKLNHNLTTQKLRAFLETELPQHMLPSQFIELNSIPKTANGKVDRKQLPAPQANLLLPSEAKIPASTSTETTLIAITQTLLGQSNLGINDNFFECGGDSLKATQLIAHIKEVFNVAPLMKDIFSAKNFRELALQIQESKETRNDQFESPIIANHDIHEAPASYAQRRMWLIDQISDQSNAYNISNSFRILGHLNGSALEKSINAIIERHSILRASFKVSSQGELQQLIAPFLYKTLTVESINGDEENIIERATRALKQKFDLGTPPLYRFLLLRHSQIDHTLILVFNHIIYDNIWSSSIFFKELSQLYNHFLDNKDFNSHKNCLPPLNIQFLDFAYWEYSRFKHGTPPKELQYWRDKLSDLPPDLEIPGDLKKPSNPTFEGGVARFTLPDNLYLAIISLSRKLQVTSFMILIGVWKLLLFRYSGQSDILVGTPSGRRHKAETENLIGLFINNLVIRNKIDPNIKFSEFLATIKSTAIDAYSNDQTPYEILTDQLSPQRGIEKSQLFKHFFIHRNAKEEARKLGDLTVKEILLHSGKSKFELCLSILEEESKLSGAIEYTSDLYSHDTGERMATHFVQLLKSALSNPDQIIRELEVNTALECKQLIHDWNRYTTDFPSHKGVGHLFSEQANKTPNNIAVTYKDTSLTYRELKIEADRFASHFLSLGIKPGDLIAVCLNRSDKLLITLLAIQMSGGAYVPLDPDFPRARLEYMLNDCNAKLYVTEKKLKDRVVNLDIPIVILEEIETIKLDPQLITAEARPDDLAYVIYTSGSTGNPKGVEVTRSGLTNFLCSMKSKPGISSEESLLALTTVCFDIAALELYLPLIVGARVVICDAEIALSPPQIIETILKNDIKIMQATPITWRMLLDYGWGGHGKLRALCGGEAIGVDLTERLLPAVSELWNLYGPTETTIWSSIQRIHHQQDAHSIGHPIANTTMYILSKEAKLQPIGVPGELIIGGAGVAKGYRNRPELTSEKFFSVSYLPDQKLYRTGDLAVRNAEGTINFLGRIDNQVKIRGYRIELGEIETCLASHPMILHAVVTPLKEGEMATSLAAYYRKCSNADLTPQELAHHLSKSLPNYMIPSHYIEIDVFPKTPNGKVDRSKLPMPITGSQNLSQTKASNPRNDLDSAMIFSWEQVLGISNISIDDSYISLGGTSVLAIKLVQEIYTNTGLEFSIAQLLTLGTIRALVDADAEAANRSTSIVKLNNGTGSTPVYCLLGLFLYHDLSQHYKDPVYGIFAKNELAIIEEAHSKQPTISIERLADIYFQAILRHCAKHTTEKISLIGASFGGLLALEVAKKLKDSGILLEDIVLLDSHLATTNYFSLSLFFYDVAKQTLKSGPQTALKKLSNKLKSSLRTTPASEDRVGDKIATLRNFSKHFDAVSPRFDLNITLVKAQKRHLGFGVRRLDDFGLSRINRGKIRIIDINTSHLSMLSKPHAGELYSLINS